MSSKISGIGISGIENRSREAHDKAYEENIITLPIGGNYRYRFGGEKHAFEALVPAKLFKQGALGSMTG